MTMRNAERCSIHIVTWNSHRHLPVLFRSIDRQDTTACTVTVVDNASGDGTIDWVKQQRPDTVLLRNFRNLGFAKAHNQAIALSLSRWNFEELDTKYVLITNPDLEFDESSIRLMMEYLDAHPEVAGCSPKLLRMTPSYDEDDPFATTHLSIFDCMGLEARKSRRVLDRSAGVEDTGQYDSAGPVFGLSGACAMIRASVLQEIAEDGAYFDEDFFAYKEDVDLAWRMQILGYTVHVVPSAVVWHERVAKSDTGGSWLTAWRARRGKSSVVNFYSTRNHGWLLMKNDDVVNVLIHTPWIVPYEFAKGLGNVVSAGGWKAMWASTVKMGKMWSKRRALHARRKQSASEIRKWFV